MPTIHDVAKTAKVSISTVSNYLNGKYVGPERSSAIKKAIEELDYTPNRVARSLKTSVSNEIMLILPNLNEKIYGKIATSITTTLAERQYTTVLSLTNNQPALEKEFIKKCISNKLAGVILCTCDPDNHKTFTTLQEQMPLVFILRRPNKMDNFSFLGFDNYDIVYKITTFLLNNGHTELGIWTGLKKFSSERACINAFTEAYNNIGLSLPNTDFIVSLQESRELVFLNATKMFNSGIFPKFILASSKLIADAISEAAYFQNIKLNEDLFILSLGDEYLCNSDHFGNVVSTYRSSQKLGIDVANLIMENISSPLIYERRQRRIKDEFSFYKLGEVLNQNGIPNVNLRKRRVLRFMFSKSENNSDTIKYFLPHYGKLHNIDIEVKELPHMDLMQYYLKSASEKSGEVDLYHVDCPWVPHLASNGAILDITAQVDDLNLREKLIPNALELLSTEKGRVYGFPTSLGAQLLFYRTDLFNDTIIQNDFSAQYGRSLKPPTNWFEYNLIARYFTRAYNPFSPTEYGTILRTDNPEQIMTDIFPRIWAYGGSIFDQSGDVCVYSDEVIQAYKNYIECLKYTNPKYRDTVNPHYSSEFMNGNIAMFVGFHDRCASLLNSAISKFHDKTSFCMIPGDSSILCGWNLCVNPYTDNLDIAINFIDWVSNIHIAIPNTILGGCSAHNGVFLNAELQDLYPWLSLSKEVFLSGRKRSVPDRLVDKGVPESQIEEILADVAVKSLSNPSDISKHVYEADKHIRSLF